MSDGRPMAETRDVIIVGGGHNGLVAAFYLAKAGFKPLVLERRAQVGGSAVTEEFHPGFRCSTLAHNTGPLRADVARDMQLERHGLKLTTPDVSTVSLQPGRPRARSLFRCSASRAGNRALVPERRCRVRRIRQCPRQNRQGDGRRARAHATGY